MNTDFTRNKILGGALFGWWQSLQDDRGARAVLRRANDITAVVMTPAFQRLRQRLLTAGWIERTPGSSYEDALAATAGLAAHVDVHADGVSIPKAMGEHVSELRFLRLLNSPDIEAVFSGIRRLMPLMDRELDVRILARDVINWGDVVKRRWTYEYAWPDPDTASRRSHEPNIKTASNDS